MPEPEELLVDAARHATAAVQGVWQRRRAEARAPGLLLGDARHRLELLIEAVLGRPWPLRVAQAAAPVPLVRRLFRPDRAVAAPGAILPGNDGTAVYLPPELPQPPPAAAPDDYALFALLQALHCERGSARFLPLAAPLVHDLYVLAEGVAAERGLRRLLPGWRQALDQLKARSAGALAKAVGSMSSASAEEVAGLYAACLNGDDAALPALPTPAASLAWSEARAHALAGHFAREPYRPWLADFFVGRIFPAEAGPGTDGRFCRSAGEAAGEEKGREARLERRPRARAAAEDEDDPQAGVWMVQTTEPLQHAEDPFGLNRPEDREADSDLQGTADSLSEMDEARLVRTSCRAREKVCSADPPPRAEDPGTPAGAAFGYAYPEWDCRSGTYLADAVRVQVALAAEGPGTWVGETLARHAGLLAEIRRRLGTLRPDRQVLGRQVEGDDIDCAALVAERCERRAGVAPAGAVYLDRRPAPRRLALLLLVDASGSTDAWVSAAARVIDVEKEAALVAASALEAAHAEFAMYAFSGEGPQRVGMREIKSFAAPWGGAAQRRLAGLEPDSYTRLGGALRHAAALLARQAADRRLLLLFSDGRPNDCDRYASRYGLEDARQALAEARLLHLLPYCFTVDREGGAYLPGLFGTGGYTIVQRAEQLPLAFIDWLRRAARECKRGGGR